MALYFRRGTILWSILVPGIFFPISWKEIKLLALSSNVQPYKFHDHALPDVADFPYCVWAKPAMAENATRSRRTPAGPVCRQRLLLRPATSRLPPPGGGRRSSSGHGGRHQGPRQHHPDLGHHRTIQKASTNHHSSPAADNTISRSLCSREGRKSLL